MAQSGIGVHQTVQSFPGSSFHFMLHGAETFFHINDVLLSGDQLLIDCVMPMDILILGQVTDGFIFGKNNISGIRRQFVRSRVVLPAPLLPIRAAFSLSSIWKLAS